MKYLKLNTITLHTITKDSLEEIKFYREISKDEEVDKRLHGLGGVMLSVISHPFFGRGFLTSLDDTLFGYLHVGNYNELEKAIYLRAAIDKNQRKNGLGKRLLQEITDYTFLNYQEVECIKLKIARDNIASRNTAISCGYMWLEDDFYIKYNPYLNLKNDIKASL